MMKVFLYVVPSLSILCTMSLPSAVQLTFAFTSILSLSQSYLLRHPAVRRWLGIQPIVTPAEVKAYSQSLYSGTLSRYEPPSPPESTTPPKKGIIDGAFAEIKGAASQVVKSAKDLKSSQDAKGGAQRLTSEEIRRAKAYEDRRQRELAQERFEARQEQLERRAERNRANGKGG